MLYKKLKSILIQLWNKYMKLQYTMVHYEALLSNTAQYEALLSNTAQYEALLSNTAQKKRRKTNKPK